ncbi:hypothetical protein ALC62_08634, partial [Cyphomyrmex costatus]
TGFVGFIISLQNLYNLSKYLIDNNFVDYVLSYKLSQDHVEMFFSSLRRMNSNNNNPTATQYLSAYKKVTVHKLNITIPSSANCNPLDDTKLISEEVNNSAAKTSEKVLTHVTKFQVSEVHQLLQQDYHVFEHSYSKRLNSDWTSSEYADEIVKYAAGSIIRVLKNMTISARQISKRYDMQNSVLQKLRALKPKNALSLSYRDTTPSLFNLMNTIPRIVNYNSCTMQKIDDQWRRLPLFAATFSKDIQEVDVDIFWNEVSNKKGAAEKSEFDELARFALDALCLPHSNADCERIFSRVNLIKTKYRNKLKIETVNGSILATECVKRQCAEEEKSNCVTFKPTEKMFERMTANVLYPKQKKRNEIEEDSSSDTEIIL